MVAGYWRSAPLDTTLLLSAPVEPLTSRRRQLRWIHLWSEMILVPLRELCTKIKFKKTPENQRAEASTCAHFNGLNVELRPGLVEELALVGWRRSASLRTLMDLVSLSSQRGFSVVRGRFYQSGTIQPHVLTTPDSSSLMNQFMTTLLMICYKSWDLGSFSIQWLMPKVVPWMEEAWPRVYK